MVVLCVHPLYSGLCVELWEEPFLERGSSLERVSELNNGRPHLAYDGNTKVSVMLFAIGGEARDCLERRCTLQKSYTYIIARE